MTDRQKILVLLDDFGIPFGREGSDVIIEDGWGKRIIEFGFYENGSFSGINTRCRICNDVPRGAHPKE